MKGFDMLSVVGAGLLIAGGYYFFVLKPKQDKDKYIPQELANVNSNASGCSSCGG